MATKEEQEHASVIQTVSASEFEDKSQFYLDLAEKLWIICPPIIIVGGTIGKFDYSRFSQLNKVGLHGES